MKANDAIRYVEEFVRETGLPPAQAVREIWEDISPIEDSTTLIQFAVAVQVSTRLRRPGFLDEEPVRVPDRPNGTTTPARKVSVIHTRHKPKFYNVGVELLQTVRYTVNGKSKAIAELSRHDVLTIAENFRRAEDGFTRHRKVMEYIAKRMHELGKQHVEELADGEKQKIARMINDLRQFKFPGDLPALEGTTTAG
jgi:hypothetical protein